MASQDLEDVFARAASIAATVPKNLQEAAFNRALDHLMKAAPTAAPRTSTGASPRTPRLLGTETGRLPALVDRTKHPDIGATSRLADRALKVLDFALNSYSVDGLSAAEIAEILTSTFRLPAKANAVAMALGRERATVNPRREGGRTLFHIMEPGEAYLRDLRAGQAVSLGERTEPPRPSPRRGRRVNEAKTGDKKEPKPAPKKAAGGSRVRQKGISVGRPGPKAAIEKLIEAGYFKNAHTISDVRGELKHAQGYDFSLQELSVSLVRLLRTNQLKRDRNQSKQYEYRA